MVKLVTLLTALASLAVPFAAHAKVFPDPSHDTKARDLDIRKVDASLRGGSVRITIIVAARPKDNSIYSAFVHCGKKSWQLAAKRAAGHITIFLYSLVTNTQTSLTGEFAEIAARTIRLNAPAFKLGCTKTNLRLHVTAKGTNGRKGLDELPKQKSARSPTTCDSEGSRCRAVVRSRGDVGDAPAAGVGKHVEPEGVLVGARGWTPSTAGRRGS